MKTRPAADQAYTVWVAVLGDWCAGRGRLGPHPHPGTRLKQDRDGLFRCRWCSRDRALHHSGVR